MSPRRQPAQQARLLRCRIQPETLREDYPIWTLDCPFTSTLAAFRREVEGELRDQGRKQTYFPIPWRQLNAALMVTIPTLVHGFEVWHNYERRALVVGSPTMPTCCPDPATIHHVIRTWATLWADHPTLAYLPAVRREALRDELRRALAIVSPEWQWQAHDPQQLIRRFDGEKSLAYEAVPSLIAALLHGQTSRIDGREVRWRKVQDSKSQKLHLVSQPIQTGYDYKVPRTGHKQLGEGYFAYKVDFSLESQAGSADPWLFINVHVQRYADEPLVATNAGRRLSVITAANQARMDLFPVDGTLVKLWLQENDEGEWEWDESLPALLEAISVTGRLADPARFCTEPRRYWQVDGQAPVDEHYLVHAEGYKYGEKKEDHELATGLSFTERERLMEALLAHLPLLRWDAPLPPDPIAFPTRARQPAALQDYGYWATRSHWSATKRQSKEERYDEARAIYQQQLAGAIDRALQGEPMAILLLYHHEHSYHGMCHALRDTFLLEEGEPFPANVQVYPQQVPLPLLQKVEKTQEDGSHAAAHRRRVRAIRAFLQHSLPDQAHRFAFIEMIENNQWAKGAMREACAREGIASQMVRSLTMKEDKEGKLVWHKKEEGYRASSAARDLILRHLGALLGPLDEVATLAQVGGPRPILLPSTFATNLPATFVFRWRHALPMRGWWNSVSLMTPRTG